MPTTNNINISKQYTLPTPEEIKKEFPISSKMCNEITEYRASVKSILEGNDSRKILIVGPCSIHAPKSAIEYAKKLKTLSDTVSDKLLIIMRVYFEKPRTTVGWKGLIYDPHLNGSYDFKGGLSIARQLMLDITKIGLPIGTEILDPVTAQYVTDFVSWAAIGARTTESQTHRQLVSGLSMPTGFKNATNGNIDIAIDAIKTATAPHAFIGILNNGQSGVFHTKGNPYCHLVLRGGNNTPNFGSEHIAYTRELMKKRGLRPNILVDCSHANSNKNPLKQMDVLDDITAQIKDGEDSIIGVMIESYLQEGNQPLLDPKNLQSDLSITDGCLGWDNTEKIINKLYQTL
jgi:3-deoxy-7-phosphoheptulonate synthase